ncbi:hypothetical protein JSY36_09805 [Bacillus sp. H-16]|uniref:hypothetical protein n=1 Tax=Alteribacter salitolerans TaxID=2912333 RepID=UPI001965896C|nr:hypothetical protein [Alteribacter salitolerans]MBM7096049.1 hypothetical protein [Alteribacter salitolerans]
MGYVPPVRDEQSFLYANRQLPSTPLIYTVQKAERVDSIRHRKYFERQVTNMERRKQVIACERELTGKGKRFDTSI